MRRAPVPCTFISIRSLAVPEKLDCRRVTHWLSWCLQLRQRSRVTFLKNTPSSLPLNLAALLLMAEASLMSAVFVNQNHTAVLEQEKLEACLWRCFILGNIYKVLLQETCISIFLSVWVAFWVIWCLATLGKAQNNEQFIKLLLSCISLADDHKINVHI